MFEPKGQRVSLLSVVDQMCTRSPPLFSCRLHPHCMSVMSVMSARDQGRLSKGMCFLSLCYCLPQICPSFFTSLLPSTSPPHLLTTPPLSFSLF